LRISKKEFGERQAKIVIGKHAMIAVADFGGYRDAENGFLLRHALLFPSPISFHEKNVPIATDTQSSDTVIGDANAPPAVEPSV